MALLVYKYQDYENTAEREQYRVVCRILQEIYSQKEDICIFLANYNIYDCELDGILIKPDSIIAVEFKNYGGPVTAVENGHWTLSDGTIIKGGSRKTVYQQANLNHVAIKRGFKDGNIVTNQALKNVPSLIVFNQPIVLDNKLSMKTQSWLHICDNQTFKDKVRDITSKSTALSKKDMQNIISRLALSDEYLDKDYSDENCFVDSNVNRQEIDEDLYVQSLDEERISIFNFTQQILRSLLKRNNLKVRILKSSDAQSLFTPYGITLIKDTLVVVEGDYIGQYCEKIGKFIHEEVRAIKPDLIFWQIGNEILDSNLHKEKTIESKRDVELEESQRNTEVSQSHSAIKFRKAKTILPHWLDTYIFNFQNAKYSPEHVRFEYNLDLSKQELKTYLGTYFPRSYAEAYCIFSNLLQIRKYSNVVQNRSSVKILDFGCGTGGETIGLVIALSKYIEKPLDIQLFAVDGNKEALYCLEQIVNELNLHIHHRVTIQTISKILYNENDIHINCSELDTFDFILCCKTICELLSKKIVKGDGYDFLASELSQHLTLNGLLLLLDVTTKNELAGLFYPQQMNKSLNAFVENSSDIVTLLPLACAEKTECRDLCFMQQSFIVSHSRKSNDESRVCYRLLCHKCLQEIFPQSTMHVNNKHVIHPTKFWQNDSSSICAKTNIPTNMNIIDSFNIVQ